MRVCVWIACLQIDVKLRLTGREVIPKPGGYTTYFTTHARKAGDDGDVSVCPQFFLLNVQFSRHQLLRFFAY